MSKRLTFGLNQQYRLIGGHDAIGSSDGHLALNDVELIEQVLRFLGLDEVNRDQLRSLLDEDPRAAETLLTDPKIVSYVSRKLGLGGLVARHGLLGRDFPSDLVQGAPPDEQEEDEVQEYVRDWWFHCQHHPKPYAGRGQENRNAFGRKYEDRDGGQVTVLDVVPDFVEGNSLTEPSTPGKEEVVFLWKDEELGNPPKPALYLNTSGKPEVEVQPEGSEAGYAKYPFEVEYLGDQDIWAFFLPSFWRAFNAPTQYRLTNTPQPLRVDVYHPRKFKLEFSMPPLKSYKRGYKLGREAGGHDPRKLCDPKNGVEKIEEQRKGWGPSELTVREHDLAAGTDSGWKKEDPPIEYTEKGEGSRTQKGLAGTTAASEALAKLPVKFYRDDTALDPGGLLATVGTILRLYGLITGIIDTIKDYAPQAGFYIDFDLQLFSGGLAVEWMWKEHEDYRTYASIDANVKLTTIKVLLELGVGVAACGGKLQVFAQVEGSHELQLSYKRVSPEGDAVIPFTSTYKITGALGARAEAGSYVKLEGKGETGFVLQFEIALGIGDGQQGLTVAVTPTWTGISFTGTFSAHALGVSYQKTGKYDLVGPKSIERIRWPDKKPYEPPIMSKYDIARVFRATLTRGWNIRVFRDGDDRVDLGDVCNEFADAVMADKGFTQRPKEIEALANSVRADLDVMGERSWARDWVEMRDIEAYIRGRVVKGCSFRAHLAEGQQDPLLNQRVGA